MAVVRGELPETGVLLLHLTPCYLVAVHGVVLAVLELRGTLAQPAAAFSGLSPPVWHTEDQV